jgi:hypothetical protein
VCDAAGDLFFSTAEVDGTVGVVLVGATLGEANFPGTTPLPLNSAGFEVAATAGLPWFTEASSVLLELAACSCWVWRGVAATCCSCAADSSCGVG